MINHKMRFPKIRNFATFIEPVKSVPRNKLVRVRFAPSPTGYLHLGGLRTALYNFLFAKSHGGQFVLRIEDTDQSRTVPGAIEQLERDLRWAGLSPDEGPTAGGSYGPYIQSERVHLYKNQAQILVDSGFAYPCFCSEKRLDLLRKEAIRMREIPKYDNKCRSLTKEEAQQKINSGHPHCIRFKLSPLTEPTYDLIRDDLNYQPCENEGDLVILKQDGFPTYHLANVVDDHMMVVTHVLRGVEWHISTPKHLLLYKAFGWDAPQYGHLPLIMNADGSKLSKRQGDIQIRNYEGMGIFPLALINYVSKAGGGFKNMDLDQIYSMDQLKDNFDLNLVHKSSCKLTDRLDEYNRTTLQQMVLKEEVLNEMIASVIKMVENSFPNIKELDLSKEHVRKVVLWSQDRIHALNDLVKPNLAFLWNVPSKEQLVDSKIDPEKLDLVIRELQQENDFELEALKSSLRRIADNNGVKFVLLMKILRMALSGLKEGPGVAEVMNILGKDSVLKRLTRAKFYLQEICSNKN
ncbi:probable glutamate--tRNA ligase, mitochondrial [Neocloeon triangulifer]|uniref:probable glutamate--tRNA ligase, mitochondrial n=1 Tax=Neocloeon triangulifer TaxID=2078957 RepID=UPI00286F265F|nr:probable glutamate--tRNA ligase, mitochondrial [Neocloeon triangulifer]